MDKKEDKENYCVLPWISFVYDKGNFLPCCRMSAYFPQNKAKFNELDILNSDDFKNLRQEILDNKQSSFCRECFDCEKWGGVSDRQFYNQLFQDSYDNIFHTDKTKQSNSLEISKEDILFTDLRFSNTCNQACRMCGPYISTAWNKDALALGMIDQPIQSSTEKSSWPVIENCRYYSFSGGEALLDPTHEEFLNHLGTLPYHQEIKLNYNTNLDIDPSRIDHFISLWKKFKSVTVYGSIDHMDSKKFEYIRYRGDFKRIIENAETINNLVGNISFSIQLTYSIYNALDLPSIIKEFLIRWNLKPKDIFIFPLHSPEYYSAQLLPEEVKKEIRKNYLSFLFEKEAKALSDQDFAHLSKTIKSLLSFIDEKDLSEKLPLFLDMTEKLDHLRKENFSKTFPLIEENIRSKVD